MSGKNITNPVIRDYVNSFYAPLTEALGEIRRDAEERGVPVILKETESLMSAVFSVAKPERILEIGCAVGYSAMFFAEAAGADATVVTAELDEDMAAEAEGNFQRLGYSGQIRLMRGDGEEVLRALASSEEYGAEKFDVIFIDAAKSHYKRFFQAALPLTHSGTVIISDNVLLNGRVASDEYDPSGKHKTNIKKMREYVQFICQDEALNTAVVPCGDGLAITTFREERKTNG